MSQAIVIHADFRQATGKGAVAKLKQSGMIPAVVYGHNYTPVHLSLNAATTNKMFRAGSEIAEDYRLCKLLIDNKPDAGETMVVVKDVQRHPISGVVQHIDFFAVRMNEKIIAPVHIRLHGKSAGVKLGGILRHILREVEVEGLPNDIPPHFDIDVTNMQIGDALHVNELSAPDTIHILTDPQAAIVNILSPTVSKEEEEGAATEAAPEAGGDVADKPAAETA